MHKRLLAGALVMLTGITMCGSPAQADPSDSEPVEKVLAKSSNGNPLFGFGPEEISIPAQNGYIYGGDPSIMVDGDTVYAYVGQYHPPERAMKCPDGCATLQQIL